MGNPDSDHRDAVFCEGGRLVGEVQASERESLSAGTALGLYSPRVALQVDESAPLRHTKATMCRSDRFKYVRRAFETDELYDLLADPARTRNLIGASEYRDEELALKERMLSWYMETCDVVPLETDRRNFGNIPPPEEPCAMTRSLIDRAGEMLDRYALACRRPRNCSTNDSPRRWS